MEQFSYTFVNLLHVGKLADQRWKNTHHEAKKEIDCQDVRKMRETLWESKKKWHEECEKQKLPDRQRRVAQSGRIKKRDKDKKER